MGRWKKLTAPFTEMLIENITILLDKEHALWNQTDQIVALKWIQKEMGAEWSIRDIFARFGINEVMAATAKVTDRRRRFLEQLKKVLMEDSRQDKCHLCGSANPVCSVEFGIGREIQGKRNWSSLPVSVALSVVTLPLFGRIYYPGRETTSQVLRLHFQLCESCRKGRTGRRGNIKLSQNDCSRHASVPLAARIGFNKILAPFELPRQEK